MNNTEGTFIPLVKLQDKFNSGLEPDWKYKNGDDFDWGSCILCEGAEAIDTGTGFKHWTPLEVDMANFEVETIDNLHFTMSLAMRELSNSKVSKLMEQAYVSDIHNELEGEELRLELKKLTKELVFHSLKLDLGECGRGGELETQTFQMFLVLFEITSLLGWDEDEIINKYIVKNVLNKIRKERGYKTGEYNKDWNGEEDNVVAYRIASDLKCGADDLFDVLKSTLLNYYDANILTSKIYN